MKTKTVSKKLDSKYAELSDLELEVVAGGGDRLPLGFINRGNEGKG